MEALKLAAPLLLLGASCTALLGVEDAVLDEGGGGSASSTSAANGSTSTSAGASASSSAATVSGSSGTGGDGGAATTSSSGGGGPGGTGGEGGTVSTATSSTDASTGSGGDGGGSAGGNGGGGASGTGGFGGGGSGGASSSSSGGGGGGGGGTCDLPAVATCPGVQPNTFSVAADLTSFWDVLAPQASITVNDELQLRIANGTTEARIQAKTSLDSPASCGVWIRLVTPNTNSSVESGLAIDTPAGLYLAYHLEGELRVRDPQGGVASIPYSTDTAWIRARFDAVGDLWFDVSPDAECWVAVDGPFAVDDGALDPQLYVARTGTSGNAASTFDDWSR